MMLQSIWDQLDEIFGPILHPIFDPIFAGLQNAALRSMLLSAVIWLFIVIGGLVFLVYEGRVFLSVITGTSHAPLPETASSRSTSRTRPQSESAKLRRTSAEKSKLEGQARESKVQASGVRVSAKMKKSQESILLTVTVHNGSDSKIDMVVVDIDLPAGIDAAIGSFRMQRLGSILAGRSESKEFLLNLRGGDPSQIGGYVEFLGASYEVSKIPLPAIEVES